MGKKKHTLREIENLLDEYRMKRPLSDDEFREYEALIREIFGLINPNWREVLFGSPTPKN